MVLQKVDLISVANKFEIPISYVGLGETIDDLYEFNSKIFQINFKS